MPTFDLLVLRCRDIEATRAFYERLGFEFIREKHDGGPSHYASALGNGVLELYPATEARAPEVGLRLGVQIDDLAAVIARLIANGAIRRDGAEPSFTDPDGRIVAVREPGH